MGEAKRRAHVLISGRVQGVWYRESTRREAERRSLAGWVRNLDDGRVEALFEGDAASVDAILAWCRRGPPHAQVQAVEITDQPPLGDLRGFEVRR